MIFQYQETALHLASENGMKGIVEILLKNPNIDVNAKNIVCVKLLIAVIYFFYFWCFCSQGGDTALTIAVDNNSKEIVEMLLKASNINMNMWACIVL